MFQVKINLPHSQLVNKQVYTVQWQALNMAKWLSVDIGEV